MRKFIPPMHCLTVADVIKALSRIPPETRVACAFDDGVIVTVYNQNREDVQVQFDDIDVMDGRTVKVRAARGEK